MTISLSIGKWRGLQQIAGGQGKFTRLALAHRQNLRRSLNPADSEAVPAKALIDLKLEVAKALTYTIREAVFALAMMENILLPSDERSNIVEVLEQVMVRDPQYWAKYYHGNDESQRFARKYSFSDHSRYYWPVPEVQIAVCRLIKNLRSVPPPWALISQFLPTQYEDFRSGKQPAEPQELIR